VLNGLTVLSAHVSSYPLNTISEFFEIFIQVETVNSTMGFLDESLNSTTGFLE
jgi:hypothetical protein